MILLLSNIKIGISTKIAPGCNLNISLIWYQHDYMIYLWVNYMLVILTRSHEELGLDLVYFSHAKYKELLTAGAVYRVTRDWSRKDAQWLKQVIKSSKIRCNKSKCTFKELSLSLGIGSWLSGFVSFEINNKFSTVAIKNPIFFRMKNKKAQQKSLTQKTLKAQY